jgi:pyridinium-3,5-bisthiocarboxylic acid mononucleotide nickel chelatase
VAHDDHEHDHGHAQEHGHDYEAGHTHVHEKQPDLVRGEGEGKLLYLDAPSGLAGDMIIAALLDLGVPGAVVSTALAALPLSGYRVEVGTRVRHGIVSASFDVDVDPGQPLRGYRDILAMFEQSALSPSVKQRAERTLHRLGTAEAKVHRVPIDQVHFHEVGAVDAIVDVVGSAAALDYLGAMLVISPLPMGRGFVRAAHGVLPLPAPATVECLFGLSTFDGGLDFEFVTPTGAAIVGAHAERSTSWPAMTPLRVGWGAGRAELPDRPNVLRAVLGMPSGPARDHDTHFTHSVLEANIDDATGELAASWVEALLSAGALDAWVTPIIMKKGRPALTISVLTKTADAGAVSDLMLRETTSLGMRRYDVVRSERPRHIEMVETPYGNIPIKLALGPYGPPQIKPEFDACVQAARAHGVPVREVLRVALVNASRKLA